MNTDVLTAISTRVCPAEMTAACVASGQRSGVETAQPFLTQALHRRMRLGFGRSTSLNAKNAGRRMFANGLTKNRVLCVAARYAALKKPMNFATDLL